MSIKVIGIDLGKSIFHLVARDQFGHIEFRKKLSRQKLKEFLSNQPLTTIAFEACGGVLTGSAVTANKSVTALNLSRRSMSVPM